MKDLVDKYSKAAVMDRMDGFAKSAMNALLQGTAESNFHPSKLSALSYDVAEAMMDERLKRWEQWEDNDQCNPKAS